MSRPLIGSLFVCLAIVGTGARVLAAEAPSNEELYRMLQELSTKLDAVADENVDLEQRLKQTESELRDARRELDRVEKASAERAEPTTTESAATRQAKGEAASGKETKEEKESSWTFGGQALWLKPYDTGHAFTVTRASRSPVPAFPLPSELTTTETSFDHGFDLSPRLWLGYEMESGAGLRGTFWYLQHDDKVTTGFDSSTTTVNASASAGSASTGAEGSGGVSASFDVPTRLPSGAPAISAGSTVRATQSLEFLTADLELTKRIDTPLPSLEFAAGLRYAMIDQSYEVRLLGTPLGPNVSTYLSHDYDFHGIGPTGALRITYPDVFTEGLSITGDLRGAVMFGERKHTIVGLPLGTNNGTVKKNDTVGMLGLGIGLVYTLKDTPPDFDVDLQAGWEGQYWLNAYDANLDEGDTGLQGFSLGGQIRW